jgi:hypothetical protein
MAEPTDLHPTKTRLALLDDVAAGRVIDDEDFTPQLHRDEGTSRVADGVWELERAGWVEQVRIDHVWQLTILGRDVQAEHADG